jgi:hypothetical protein
MKCGDMVQITGDTVPMYNSIIDRYATQFSSQIGYAKNGTIGILFETEKINEAEELIFHRILMPEFGQVWIRNVWVQEII